MVPVATRGLARCQKILARTGRGWKWPGSGPCHSVMRFPRFAAFTCLLLFLSEALPRCCAAGSCVAAYLLTYLRCFFHPYPGSERKKCPLARCFSDPHLTASHRPAARALAKPVIGSPFRPPRGVSGFWWWPIAREIAPVARCGMRVLCASDGPSSSAGPDTRLPLARPVDGAGVKPRRGMGRRSRWRPTGGRRGKRRRRGSDPWRTDWCRPCLSALDQASRQQQPSSPLK